MLYMNLDELLNISINNLMEKLKKFLNKKS